MEDNVIKHNRIYTEVRNRNWSLTTDMLANWDPKSNGALRFHRIYFKTGPLEVYGNREFKVTLSEMMELAELLKEYITLQLKGNI